MDKYLKNLLSWMSDHLQELLKDKNLDRHQHRDAYNEFLKIFVAFFHADGDGLPLSFLKPVRELLSTLGKA